MAFELTTSLGRSAHVALIAGCLTAWCSTAHANVTISSNVTSNMSCSAGVCAATAANAVLNTHDLEAMLASSDVTVQTGTVAGSIVAGAFNWASAHSLTLDANKSITVNHTITVSGSGGLNLITNDGGSGGKFSFGATGNIVFWDTSSPLTINGAPYTLLSNIADLASAIAAHPSGNFALSKSYNAAADGTYNASPVSTAYGGNLQGLGNTISRLHIAGVSGGIDAVGLFMHLESSGSIQNLRMTDLSIAGGPQKSVGGVVGINDGFLFGNSAGGTISGASQSNVGMLAGTSTGMIDSCHSSGQLQVGGAKPDRMSFGGLVGVLTGLIERSDSSAAVGTAHGPTGGLVGLSDGGTIVSSHAVGPVSNISGTGVPPGVGGLLGAGVGSSSIVNSYATGNVTGSHLAGGLVGYLVGDVSGSHAGGNVIGDDAGGLVGENVGSIVGCSASGTVSATFYAGGLSGYNGGTIAQSFATGAVSNSSGSDSTAAGGVVATSAGMVSDSYATGSVSGARNGGGFAGRFVSGSLASVYSTGSGTGSTFDGGFVGSNEAPSNQGYRSAYWNTTTSGTTQAIGTGNPAPITGLTSAQLQAGLPAGFSANIWAQSPSINNGFPYLKSNPPPPP